MEQAKEPLDFLVIGAGICGLLCAETARRSGARVRVLDKGRGFGGRMATRRLDGGARADHGAQYFTVRDARFQAWVDEWLERGVAREWFRHMPEDTAPGGHPRYCGAHGMSDIAKHLALDLDVRRQSQVAALARAGDVWRAGDAAGSWHEARGLVVTAPLPQALDLVDALGEPCLGEDDAALRRIRYEKGLALMATLDGPSGLPAPGGMKVDDPVLGWIADNQAKGISPDVPVVTLHARPDFAEAQWDAPDAKGGRLMLSAARRYLAHSAIDYRCHRWGFTRPLETWGAPFYAKADLDLVLAGDAFGGERVEGAALSGIEAGRYLVASAR